MTDSSSERTSQAGHPRGHSAAITQFAKLRPQFQVMVRKLEQLIRERLGDDNIEFQAVEGRAKEVDSFAEKLVRKGQLYADPLVDMTDLAGLRVVVYSLADVDRVVALLDREFVVTETVDMRKNLAADQFGYKSVHKIARISSDRARLPEWSSFARMTFEVQVRTLLEHAWAVTSHAVLYKREQDIPPSYQRQLNRIAGLLELADEQLRDLWILRFGSPGIERESVEPPASITPALSPQTFLFTDLLPQYLAGSSHVRSLRKAAESAGVGVLGSSPKSLAKLMGLCRMLRLRHVSDVDELLEQGAKGGKGLYMAIVANLRTFGHVTSWHANDEQLVMAAIVVLQYRRVRRRTLVAKGWGYTYVTILRETGRQMKDAAEPL